MLDFFMGLMVYKSVISRYNRGMLIYQIFAVIFLVATPVVAQHLTSLFHLDRWGAKAPDLAFPILAVALVLVSGRFFTHNFLPHYLLALSLLAMAIILNLVIKTKSFSYRRFGKRFWRFGFFVTLAAYVLTLVLIFLQTN